MVFEKTQFGNDRLQIQIHIYQLMVTFVLPFVANNNYYKFTLTMAQRQHNLQFLTPISWTVFAVNNVQVESICIVCFFSLEGHTVFVKVSTKSDYSKQILSLVFWIRFYLSCLSRTRRWIQSEYLPGCGIPRGTLLSSFLFNSAFFVRSHVTRYSTYSIQLFKYFEHNFELNVKLSGEDD